VQKTISDSDKPRDSANHAILTRRMEYVMMIGII